VSWKKGTLGNPRQFQETLALLHPGQKVSDLLEKDLAYVSDYDHNTSKVRILLLLILLFTLETGKQIVLKCW